MRAPVPGAPRGGRGGRRRPPRTLRLAQLGRWPRPFGFFVVALVAIVLGTVWHPLVLVAAGAWGIVAGALVLDAALRGRRGVVAALVAGLGGPFPAFVLSFLRRRDVRKVGPTYGRAVPLALLAAVGGGLLAYQLGRWAVRETAFTTRVPSSSMAPKVRKGDLVVVSPLLLGQPTRGEIVAVRTFPQGRRALDRRGPYLGVYRVIGLPGDHVVALDGQLYICSRAPQILDGIQASDGCEKRDELGYVLSRTDDFGPIAVPSGRYFVLADNRQAADDSRAFGAIPRRVIAGRVVATVWPVARAGVR